MVRINETVDALRELVTTALEANFALISIAPSEVMKYLAGWGAIIAIPTMIAGFYGMNFQSSCRSSTHKPYGYPLVLPSSTASLCLLIYFRFKRAGWL